MERLVAPSISWTSTTKWGMSMHQKLEKRGLEESNVFDMPNNGNPTPFIWHVWKMRLPSRCHILNDMTNWTPLIWYWGTSWNHTLGDLQQTWSKYIFQMYLQICKFRSWFLYGLEEEINCMLTLPLQISNKHLIEHLRYGLQLHYACTSKLEWLIH